MMRALLALAAGPLALALAAAPAAAEHRDGGRQFGFVASPSGFSGDLRGGDRRGTRASDTIFVYDRGYQGDSAWRPESFNDWWHERPNRSYPAWVQRNQNCQRTWWQGEELRC